MTISLQRTQVISIEWLRDLCFGCTACTPCFLSTTRLKMAEMLLLRPLKTGALWPNSLAHATDPELAAILVDRAGAGARNVYIATRRRHKPIAARTSLPAGAMLVVHRRRSIWLMPHSADGSIAADSEQAGLLARQQEIENLPARDQSSISSSPTNRRSASCSGGVCLREQVSQALLDELLDVKRELQN